MQNKMQQVSKHSNLARKIDWWDFKPELLQIHVEKHQSELFIYLNSAAHHNLPQEVIQALFLTSTGSFALLPTHETDSKTVSLRVCLITLDNIWKEEALQIRETIPTDLCNVKSGVSGYKDLLSFCEFFIGIAIRYSYVFVFDCNKYMYDKQHVGKL